MANLIPHIILHIREYQGFAYKISQYEEYDIKCTQYL